MYGVRARLLHFLVKIRQVAAPCSISLRQILMKVHSFSKFDMSNRNHDKAVFFGLYEKYEQFQILRDIGYVNHLLFSRALSLSRQNTRSGSRPPKFPEISVQNATDRFGPTGKVSKKRVLRWATGNKNSDRSDREKWSTSKGGPIFSKLFRLDRTDPLRFGPKFPVILVEWIAPYKSSSLIQEITPS